MYQILNAQSFATRYGETFPARSPFDEAIPLVELSDAATEQIYYYRWHVYCSHIHQTPKGYVVTEFSKDVPWAGIYNTIVCAAGHHLYEGRWLRNRQYIEDYARFWYAPEANRHLYSCWLADAVYAACKTWGDFTLAKELYEDLKQGFAYWKEKNMASSGLYYQFDVNDGMELMIGGHGFRPTINAYQYGDAQALAKIADMLGRKDDQDRFLQEAETIKQLVDTHLWDDDAQFYKTLSDMRYGNNISVPLDKTGFRAHLDEDCYQIADVRELIGFVPWYFGLPDEDKSIAWRFLKDEAHFAAPYGPTTAERCHPGFMGEHHHECLWNGPVWPFATSQTLTALGTLLADYTQDIMTKHDYFALLKQYAESQTLDGRPWIDEDQDPFTGVWLAREALLQRDDPHTDRDRGIHYNHSTFCDLVLTGLAGLRVREDDILQIDPMFTEEDLSYLCADGIPYHGHSITVVWDRDGSRYGLGQGLLVFCDGMKLGASPVIQKLTFTL